MSSKQRRRVAQILKTGKPNLEHFAGKTPEWLSKQFEIDNHTRYIRRNGDLMGERARKIRQLFEQGYRTEKLEALAVQFENLKAQAKSVSTRGDCERFYKDNNYHETVKYLLDHLGHELAFVPGALEHWNKTTQLDRFGFDENGKIVRTTGTSLVIEILGTSLVVEILGSHGQCHEMVDIVNKLSSPMNSHSS